jgi:hypothetical protein
LKQIPIEYIIKGMNAKSVIYLGPNDIIENQVRKLAIIGQLEKLGIAYSIESLKELITEPERILLTEENFNLLILSDRKFYICERSDMKKYYIRLKSMDFSKEAFDRIL